MKRVVATSRRDILWTIGAGLGLAALTRGRAQADDPTCRTTQTVPIEGPYFLDEPEERVVTGSGLVLRGRVAEAGTCTPIVGAKIVRWHANAFGVYEDHYRAAMRSQADGLWEMQSIVPGSYAGLARHVHFLVSAPGYRDLITQWQVADGVAVAPMVTFDFALTRV